MELDFELDLDIANPLRLLVPLMEPVYLLPLLRERSVWIG
jgi:hypothetical protein